MYHIQMNYSVMNISIKFPFDIYEAQILTNTYTALAHEHHK